MDAKTAALAFKAWAQENRLIGTEFPVRLEETDQDRDALFDSLKVTAASERVLRSRHINAVGYSDSTREVFVLMGKKPTKNDLKKLPETFGDDVAVRYIHAGLAHAAPPAPSMVHTAYTVTHNGMYTCGSSINTAKHIGAGTLGCLVRDVEGNLYGLTNNHVSGMCNYAPAGEKILAPGHLDIEAMGIDPFTIGYHHQSLTMVPGVPDNVDVGENSDAALIKIADASKVSSMQGAHYDTPDQICALTAGINVEKVGRSTQLTSGRVMFKVVGAFPVGYQIPVIGAQQVYFDDVYMVSGHGNPFSSQGDSGSLVVSTIDGVRKAVGIVFAGNAQGDSFILPLIPILDRLNVGIVSRYNV